MATSYTHNSSKYKLRTKPTKEGLRIAAADDFGVLDLGRRTSMDEELTMPKGHGWPALNAHVVTEAIHTSDTVISQGGCLPGTRKAFLQRLEDRVLSSSSSAPNVVWLNGPAGMGKTAIMNTLCQTLAKTNSLLASFFFFRSDGRRNTTNALIPTLASQISRRSSLAKQYVGAMVEEDPLIFTHPYNQQAHALLARPLIHAFEIKPHAWPQRSPLVILIDGLDECIDEENQVNVIDALFDVVFQIWTHTKIRLRLLISSRPDARIQERFLAKEKEGLASVVFLEDSPDGRADIQRFYDARFEEIRRSFSPFASRLRLDENWPSSDERRRLMGATAGQFAFAKTAMRFAGDPAGNPKERLASILLCSAPLDDSDPSAALDQLYFVILSLIPKPILSQALRIIGAILIEGGIPPSPLFLEFFLRLPLGFLDQVFNPLKSLFRFGDRSTDIRVYHSTLADFLFDPTRSQKLNLFIDRRTIYCDIAKSAIATCRSKNPPSLEVMDAILRYLPTLENILARAKIEGKVLRDSLDNLQLSSLPAWAVSLLSIVQTQLASHLRKQRSLTGSFRLSLKVKWQMPVSLGNDVQRRTSLYEKTQNGRFCLVLMFGTSRERIPFVFSGATFGQALLRRALAREPRLFQSDQSLGWNMYDPLLTNQVFEYWRSSENELNPFLGLTNAVDKYHRDAIHFILREDWPADNIDLILPWHRDKHQHSENPWTLVDGPGRSVSSSASNATCLPCLQVINNCRAELIKCWLDGATWGPDFKVLDALYPLLAADKPLGRDLQLLKQGLLLSKRVEAGKQGPRLNMIRSDLEGRVEELERDWDARVAAAGDQATRVALDDLRDKPYTAHCIPKKELQ